MDFSFAACRNPAWRAASGGEPEKRSRLCFIGFFCWVMDLKSDLPGMAGRPFPAEERMRRAHDGPAPEYAPPSGSAMIILSGVDRASDVWKTRVGLPVLRTISRGGNSPPLARRGNSSHMPDGYAPCAAEEAAAGRPGTKSSASRGFS